MRDVGVGFVGESDVRGRVFYSLNEHSGNRCRNVIVLYECLWLLFYFGNVGVCHLIYFYWWVGRSIDK